MYCMYNLQNNIFQEEKQKLVEDLERYRKAIVSYALNIDQIVIDLN